MNLESNSRGIGYQESRKIGVIANPSINVKKYAKGKDLFLIIGTDGLWNIMETIEVLFLLRREVIQENETPVQEMTPLPGTRSTPSQRNLKLPMDKNLANILATYARVRLGNMAAKYRMKVDDIAVIVIGLF